MALRWALGASLGTGAAAFGAVDDEWVRLTNGAAMPLDLAG